MQISTVNIISEPLVLIIVTCSITLYSFFHQPLNYLCQLFICLALIKPARKLFSIVLIEAFHVFTLGHHLHPLHNFSLVVSDVFECKEE